MTARRLLRRLRTLLRIDHADADIQRELDFHLAMEQKWRERGGADTATARKTALQAFGDPTRVREAVRDTRGITFWDSFRLGQLLGVIGTKKP